MRTADHPDLVLQFAQYLVHALRGNERPARQVGVGQPRPLIQEGERAVMGDGGAVFAQGRGQCGMRCGLDLPDINFTPSAISGGSGTLSA
jgi:hypothetical protein